MSVFRRLLGRLRPYRAAFAASLVAATVASIFDGATFILLIPFLRLLFAGEAGTSLLTVVGLIMGAMVVKNAAHYAAVRWGADVQERVVRDLRVDVYRHLQTQGLAFFRRTRSGDLLTRLVTDTDQVRSAVSLALASTVRNGVLVLVYVVILFALSWRLALVTMMLAPALAVGLRPLFARVKRRARAMVDARAQLGAMAGEAIAGARVIKAHAAEREEARRFQRAAADAADAAVALQRVAFLTSPLGEVLGTAVIVTLLLLGVAWAGPGGSLAPEVFLAFLAIVMRLLPPVKQLAQFPAQVSDALAAAARVFQLLDRPAEDVDHVGARPFAGPAPAIQLESVSVAYEPGRFALRDVTLVVPRGEVVALVGPSGAGKSTLADLLPRLVEPTTGRVLMDGVPLTAFTRASLRRAIGSVGQETVIFHDTVRANIALGLPEASDAQVRAAATAAHAHEFILRLPAGYATVLGERGLTLAGGERQRIALARTLLRDPAILILDEATSAVDAEAERVIQDALAGLFKGRTVLVIAHRASTIAMADRVVELAEGRVIGDALWQGGLPGEPATVVHPTPHHRPRPSCPANP